MMPRHRSVCCLILTIHLAQLVEAAQRWYCTIEDTKHNVGFCGDMLPEILSTVCLQYNKRSSGDTNSLSTTHDGHILIKGDLIYAFTKKPLYLN